MSDEDGDGIQLTVRGAAKRDAGRGVARLSEAARRQLGVLSGDSVVVEGDRATVAKVWPARTGLPADVVRIDADARANAGVTIGDAVRVRPETVDGAESVTVLPPASLAGAEDGVLERVVGRQLRGRPVSEGEQFTLERVTDEAFHVQGTVPDGPVRVTEDTELFVVPLSGAGAGSGGAPASSTDSHASSSGSDGSVDAGSSRGAADASSGADGTTPGDNGGADGQYRVDPERLTVSYEDIGGLDEELEQVREMIELPLDRPDLFRRLGVDPPTGVLLYGPPGTGKTLIAKAVANEVDATFFSVDGPEIVSKYKGESEQRLREVFAAASEAAPSVIFFDEIDSVAAEREDGGDLEQRVVGQLLSLMDGLDAREDVIVIGATNRADALDQALRRGGRFDREIEIGVPDEAGRREILDVHTRNMPLAADVSPDSLAARTHGFVGADVDALATEAAMRALRRVRESPPEGTTADVGDGGDGATTQEASGEADGADGADGAERAEGVDGSEAASEPDEPRGVRPASELAAAELSVTKADFDRALAAVEPSAMREFVAETPTTGFDDVGGLEDAKQVLRETVEWPLAYPRLFAETSTDPPSGVLLHGPPGTGKTLLARALAGETEVNFVHVDGSELIDKYVGESEKAVREVFDRARQGAPSIVFLDEVDALVGTRGAGTHEVTERVVSQLLTELDGLRENPNLVVIAATNRKDAIDPALLRPGRIDLHVEVGAPDVEAREAILEVHARGKPLADDLDLDGLAAELEGYTGADLEGVVRTASMTAIREFAAEHGPAAADERAGEIEIGHEHVERALESVEPTLGDASGD